MRSVVRFAVLLALLVGACGGDDDDVGTSTSGASADTTAVTTSATPQASTTQPPTTTLPPTTTTLPVTTTTPPMRTDLLVHVGRVDPNNLWDASVPSRVGSNGADPVDFILALKPTGGETRDAILAVGAPIVGDFNGDGVDDLTTAAELFQPSMDPRNGGCGTPDGLSNDFLPPPITDLVFTDAQDFGVCFTRIDPTQEVTIFVYSAQAGPQGERLLGDFVFTFDPLADGVFQAGFVLSESSGAASLFVDEAPDDPLFSLPLFGSFD